MNEDTLKSILQQADNYAGMPEVSNNLAGRVQHKATRQALQRRHTIMVAALVLIVTGVTLWGKFGTMLFHSDTMKNPQEQAAATPADRDQTDRNPACQTELAESIRRLNRQVALSRQLRKQDKLRTRLTAARQTRPGRPAPLTEIRHIADHAAAVLYVTADDKAAKPDQIPSAIADFQRLMQLYPESPLAAKAQSKINELRNSTQGDA